MTPAQLDHLARLKRHLETLLANAEKRTPGEWKVESSRAYCADEGFTHNVVGPPSDFMYLQELPDAAFIASCAGNAEAGWKSTLAAIAHLQLISQSLYLAELPAGEEAQNNADHALKIILAAWPIEKLP